jgi:Spy/CpxP family protein refolding chaperone
MIRVNMKLLSVAGLVLLTGIALSACQASTSASNAPPAASGTPAAAADDKSTGDPIAIAELHEHHRHHHLGGVTQFVAMSLDTLGGEEAKHAQIDKIQDSLYACMAPVEEIQNKVLLALADGVAAGTVDKAKIDAIIAQLDSAPNVHVCSAEPINQLHALLSPAERAALAHKVEAHWEVWQKANHDAAGHDREPQSQLSEATRELNLTPDQVEKVSAAMQTALAGIASKFDHNRAGSHREAFIKGFPGESFDAKATAATGDTHVATHGTTRMALFYETLAPLLTPTQRTTLAEHLREHASHKPTAISTK